MQKFPFIIDDCSIDIDCKTKAVFIEFFGYPLDIFVFFWFLKCWNIVWLYLKSVNSSRLWEMNDFNCSEILARSELSSDFFFEFSFKCCDEVFSFFNFPTREKPEIFLGMMNHRIATFLITKYTSYNINKPILRTRIFLAFRCKVWKFYGKSSILPILISFCNLVVCKWCCTAWTVSLYFESFVYLILVVDIREASHYAFHKIQIHRKIRIGNINPSSSMIYESFPLSICLIYIFATLFYKSLNSDFFFNVFFPINTKCFLNCFFYW